MSLLGFFILGANLLLVITATAQKDACNRVPDAGQCLEKIPGWYFDPRLQKCTKFLWGGCHGSVPFKSHRDCVRADCAAEDSPKPAPQPLAARCNLWPSSGSCSRSLKRWHFNPHTQECTSFVWSGCKGLVPFSTRRECIQAGCAKNRCNVAPMTGPCKALIRGYYFDAKKKSCTAFLWGGCLGVLPFATREQCEKSCPFVLDPCLQKPETGICTAAFLRYFFNPETKKCESFLWGGCGGTVPFESKSECTTAKCRCKLHFNRGPCDDTILRWFYDEALQSCSFFLYGGCKGTVPFKTEKQCLAADCRSVVGEGSDEFIPVTYHRRPRVGPLNWLLPARVFNVAIPFTLHVECRVSSL